MPQAFVPISRAVTSSAMYRLSLGDVPILRTTGLDLRVDDSPASCYASS